MLGFLLCPRDGLSVVAQIFRDRSTFVELLIVEHAVADDDSTVFEQFVLDLLHRVDARFRVLGTNGAVASVDIHVTERFFSRDVQTFDEVVFSAAAATRGAVDEVSGFLLDHDALSMSGRTVVGNTQTLQQKHVLLLVDMVVVPQHLHLAGGLQSNGADLVAVDFQSEFDDITDFTFEDEEGRAAMHGGFDASIVASPLVFATTVHQTMQVTFDIEFGHLGLPLVFAVADLLHPGDVLFHQTVQVELVIVPICVGTHLSHGHVMIVTHV